MSGATNPVNIQILDKEYMISCPDDEKDALLHSARLLNNRLRQVRDGGKVLGTERMAVLAALNLIHESLQEHRLHESRLNDINGELHRLGEKIGAAVARRAPPETLD